MPPGRALGSPTVGIGTDPDGVANSLLYWLTEVERCSPVGFQVQRQWSPQRRSRGDALGRVAGWPRNAACGAGAGFSGATNQGRKVNSIGLVQAAPAGAASERVSACAEKVRP